MYRLKYPSQFKKSLKKYYKRGLDINKLVSALGILQRDGILPAIYRPHALIGNFRGCMECHIAPDWLLVWKQDDEELVLLLVDIGSHSDVFG